LAQLQRARCFPFPKDGQQLPAPDEQGVYVIYSPRVLHVGRAHRGQRGLRQRLNNHLRGQSSFTRGQFEGKGSRLRRGYTYRFVIVRSPRPHALLEHYACGYLCRVPIGTGALREAAD
jgi:hypothetical protein